MLFNARGGARDLPRALELFRQAAARDHSGAKFALGVALNRGHGVPADPPMAREWFLAAARQGHAEAQLAAGRYLANGTGGAADHEQARRWLEQAAKRGVAAARTELEALSRSRQTTERLPRHEAVD